MEPLKPHWVQPSHPDRLEVVVNAAAFTSKSIALADFPPFASFAKMSFPPCTVAPSPTYATVQMGVDSHLDLNSDLLYINHSCEPSLIFDTSSLTVLVGPRGLKKGDELSFFYPSTEWSMAQPFTCLCQAPTCRGTIAGAKDMSASQLSGLWINAHIRELLEARDAAAAAAVPNGNGSVTAATDDDPAAKSLRDALRRAEDVAAEARAALRAHLTGETAAAVNGCNGTDDLKAQVKRREGVTARELAGEMGGDTVA